MENNKFNDFTLTDAEVTKILDEFKDIIKSNSFIFGKYNEDCEQEIKLQIYKTLTKNRSDKQKNKK